MLAPPRQASVRVVEVVPALLVSLLHDAGKIPQPPFPPDRSTFGFQAPGLSEMQAYSWVVQWKGARTDETGFRPVSGVAAYRDDYDFHTASRVREIVLLAGSKRASIDLLRWIRDEARLLGRRTIGSFDLTHTALRSAAAHLGARETRVVMEAA